MTVLNVKVQGPTGRPIERSYDEFPDWVRDIPSWLKLDAQADEHGVVTATAKVSKANVAKAKRLLDGD